MVYQDLVKINIACRDNSILKNPEVVKAFTYAKENGKQVHFMGLLSDGGVHSSLDHLLKLCDISKEYGVSDKTFVHCFMDGRDTDPRSGKGFIESLRDHLKVSGGKIASIIGRYYAMDRDKRWERVKEEMCIRDRRSIAQVFIPCAIWFANLRSMRRPSSIALQRLS